MQPIYPVPPSDRRRHCADLFLRRRAPRARLQFNPKSEIENPRSSRTPHRAAFTLIEVLIALAILALLAFATASSLSTALRAGSAADLAGEALLISDALLAEYRLTGSSSNTAVRHAAAWTFNVTETATGPSTNRIAWSVWEIVARDRPSIQRRLAFEQSE